MRERAPESETTNPLNPIRPRSSSVRSARLAGMGTPSNSLKELITVSAPAFAAAANGGRYHSRIARGETSV